MAPHKRKLVDLSVVEFQTRADSLRSKIESLEQSQRHKRRRPEEEVYLEKLVTHSVNERLSYEKIQARPGVVEASLMGKKGRPEEMPIQRDMSHSISIVNRPKKPLLNYELPRIDRIRGLSNSSMPIHGANRVSTAMEDDKRS